MRKTGRNFTYTDDFGLPYVSFTIDLNVSREHPPITEASKEDSAWGFGRANDCAQTRIRRPTARANCDQRALAR
jgi:hypothetical protein